MVRITCDALAALCEAASTRAGARPGSARALADATVEAERVGNRAVGVGHLFDYLDGYRGGRIAADAEPEVRRAAPAVLDVDAREGLAQDAFAAARAALVAAAREQGVAVLWIRNSFTCGELGYYPRAMAGEGLIALAAANSPSQISLGGSPSRVLGTNPLAYGFPRPGATPVVIDQASSATAFVNVRRAAEAGDPIPQGWAVDSAGDPTTDAAAAVAGALLPFGGHRGGNVALLVEILATLSGANFAIDAPRFDQGTESPRIGVFLLCLDPSLFSGSGARLAQHLEKLRDAHGVRLPALELGELPDEVDIDDALLRQLRDAAS